MHTFIYSILIITVGMGVALQQVLNSNLRMQLASPWWAAFISYLVGIVATAILACALPGPRLSFATLTAGGGSWISWAGGLFGALFITTMILAVPRFGAATVLALTVVGQMIAAMVLDHFALLDVPQHPISLVRLAGAGCLILGVVLVCA